MQGKAMDNKNKWVFIINPTAGSGFAQKYSETIRAKCQQFTVDAQFEFTSERGHARKISAEYAKNGYGHVIAVGGDGTMNEVINGLVNYNKVIFGTIPAGTGNDFIPITGFPERFTDEDWKIFFDKNTIGLDVGKCNENHFINGMGLGFDAHVAAENYRTVQETGKGSKAKYWKHIIKTILFYDEHEMTVLANGQTETTKCFINTIAIGRRFAGGFFLTPNAIANDGMLDVCMIEQLSKTERFKMLPKVPKGTHITNKKVNYYQTQNLVLDFGKEVPTHLDGELFFATKFEVSVLPGHIQIIYKPGSDHFFKTGKETE